jgi:hypothetical protein
LDADALRSLNLVLSRRWLHGRQDRHGCGDLRIARVNIGGDMRALHEIDRSSRSKRFHHQRSTLL